MKKHQLTNAREDNLPELYDQLVLRQCPGRTEFGPVHLNTAQTIASSGVLDLNWKALQGRKR